MHLQQGDVVKEDKFGIKEFEQFNIMVVKVHITKLLKTFETVSN